MKKNAAMRALLMSATSLLLCVSMLVGTTFAWFTDTVTSGNNVIASGNLDIELQYWNGTTWADVADKTDILTNDLWEPGVTEIAYLRIANAGSLALKYQLGINIVSEKPGTNQAGQQFMLSDHIDFGIVEDVNGETNPFANRELAVGAVTGAKKISAGYADSSKLYPKDKIPADVQGAASEKYFALVVYMDTSVDNTANHKTSDDITDANKYRPEINLGINVFATQLQHEKDSFDETYDKDTAVFTVADANDMMAEGKDTALVNCNEPNRVLMVPANFNGRLILENVNVASIQEVAPVSTMSLDEEEYDPTATNIVILGNVSVKALEEGQSAITGTKLNIYGSGNLTAIAKGTHAYGIGGDNTQTISIHDVTIKDVRGGSVQAEFINDTKYGKDEPEGGAAIGSAYNGAVISLDNVTIEEAHGGSKAAAIGARYWTGVTINIKDSTLSNIYGGNASAAIGGSRVSSDCSESKTAINISGSTITNAVGGQFGAGIGSGYDTHCASNQPMCEINITGSNIKATGGMYAAGIGTGFHNAALKGEISSSTVNAVSGKKVYKDTYTTAMDIGFGVVDPAREGKQKSSIIYNGETISNVVTKKIEVNSAE